MYEVESNRKGRGDRGQAPEERKRSKEGGRGMLKEMKPCVTASTVKESCVMAPEKGDEALCNGFEGKGILCDCFAEERIKVLCDCFKRESKMEPCVMVSSGNELCVTAHGDDDQTLCTTDSTNKRHCATEVKHRKPCVTVSRGSELCVTARVEEDGDSTPKPKRKLWVSWQPSGSEDGSESESEREEEWKIGNETVVELSLEEWKHPNGRRISRPNQHLQNHSPGGLGGRVRVSRI